MRAMRLAVGAIAVMLSGAATAAASTPTAQELPLTTGAHPAGITGFYDGYVWFTEPGLDQVGRVAPWGQVEELPTVAGAKPTRILNGGYTLYVSEDNVTGKRGNIALDRSFTETTVNVNGTGAPNGTQTLAAGADGKLWYFSPTTHALAYGAPTDLPEQHLISDSAQPTDAVAGPDLRMWIADGDGAIIDYGQSAADAHTSIPVPGGSPHGIAIGVDGTPWFTDSTGNRVGHIVGGAPQMFNTSTGAHPEDIALGPDGNLWFTEPGLDRIGRVTPTGVVTEFGTGISAGAHPEQITAGPDGLLYFTEPGIDRIGRINTESDAPTVGDLLRNPGAETAAPATAANGPTPIPGWVTSPSLSAAPYGAVPGLPDNTDALAHAGGARLFAGGPATKDSYAVQVVDLARATGYTTPGASVFVEGYLIGRPTDDGVNAGVNGTFYDAAGNAAGGLGGGGTIGAPVTPMTLHGGSTNVRMRWIVFSLSLHRDQSSTGYNTAAADNADVHLTAPNAPPPPPGGGCEPQNCPHSVPTFSAKVSAVGKPPSKVKVVIHSPAAGAFTASLNVAGKSTTKSTSIVPGDSTVTVALTSAMQKHLVQHGEQTGQVQMYLTDTLGTTSPVTTASVKLKPVIGTTATHVQELKSLHTTTPSIGGTTKISWTTPVKAKKIVLEVIDRDTGKLLGAGPKPQHRWRSLGRHTVSYRIRIRHRELLQYYIGKVRASVRVTVMPLGNGSPLVETVALQTFESDIDLSKLVSSVDDLPHALKLHPPR